MVRRPIVDPPTLAPPLWADAFLSLACHLVGPIVAVAWLFGGGRKTWDFLTDQLGDLAYRWGLYPSCNRLDARLGRLDEATERLNAGLDRLIRIERRSVVVRRIMRRIKAQAAAMRRRGLDDGGASRGDTDLAILTATQSMNALAVLCQSENDAAHWGMLNNRPPIEDRSDDPALASAADLGELVASLISPHVRPPGGPGQFVLRI